MIKVLDLSGMAAKGHWVHLIGFCSLATNCTNYTNFLILFREIWVIRGKNLAGFVILWYGPRAGVNYHEKSDKTHRN